MRIVDGDTNLHKYIYINCAPVVPLGGLTPARPIIGCSCVHILHYVAISFQIWLDIDFGFVLATPPKRYAEVGFI